MAYSLGEAARKRFSVYIQGSSYIFYMEFLDNLKDLLSSQDTLLLQDSFKRKHPKTTLISRVLKVSMSRSQVIPKNIVSAYDSFLAKLSNSLSTAWKITTSSLQM